MDRCPTLLAILASLAALSAFEEKPELGPGTEEAIVAGSHEVGRAREVALGANALALGPASSTALRAHFSWDWVGVGIGAVLVCAALAVLWNRQLRREVAKTTEELRIQAMLLEQIGDRITATDLEGRITYLNSASARTIGLPREQLIGQSVEAFGDDSTRGATQREIIEETRTKGQWSGEVVNYNTEGEAAILELRTWVVRDAGGKPVGMCGVSTDITARKRAEEALHESEQRFRAIADYTYDWENWVGPDGRLKWVNPAVQRVTGYTPGECLEMEGFPLPIIHEDDREMIAREFKGAVEGTSGSDLQCRLRRKDGSVIWVAVSWQPIYDDKGNCLGHRSTLQDITPRKRAEELAQQRQADLAHASRLSTMGELASGLAHELNQPLATICAFAGAGKNTAQKAGTEALVVTLEKITGQAERAGKIIERLRRLVRKQEPQGSTVNINDIIRETVELVEAEARLNGIKISFDPADRLPSIWADPIQVQQVILNLMRNGMEAMTQTAGGQRGLAVRTATTQDADITVTIRDTGTGIDEETAAKLFKPFFTTTPDGMGLGLSISRSIVEAHAGRLWATPNPDRGTTLHLTLPVKSPS